MPDLTKNFGLTKPSPLDFYDIHQFNENMDKIDEALNNCYSKDNKPTTADIGAVPVCKGVNYSADLNDYKTEGTYYFPDSYTHSNLPPNSVNGWLDVKVYGNGVKQIWYRFGTPDITDHAQHTRTHAPSTGWGEWVKVLTSKDTCVATYGTKDLTPGTSALETGKLYFVYE